MSKNIDIYGEESYNKFGIFLYEYYETGGHL